jgi:hypothetical protein
MRTFKTLPENRAFFEQYATLIPTLYRLGFLAQIVSALTEISIIYAIVVYLRSGLYPGARSLHRGGGSAHWYGLY